VSATFNYFYRCDVTVLTYAEGATTSKTYSFTNKFLKDSSSATTYWPILQSLGEFSVAAGETLPTISLSAVEIDNSIGTFGANRKFSDVLQRYTPVEQSIVLYIGQVSILSDTVSSWTQIAQGVVSDWKTSANGEKGTLTFNVRAAKYKEAVLNLEVARTVNGMENAPISSLGRAVPLLVGSGVEVLPVRISSDYATTGKYAWGTCYYQFLENDSTSAKVYTKNYADQWEELTGGNTDYSGTTPTGQFALSTYESRAFKLNINGSSIVTGVQLRAKANGLASTSAILTVFILRVDYVTYAVLDTICTASVPLSAYDAINADTANTNFAINVSFDKPGIIAVGTNSFYHYYLGFSVSSKAANDLSLHYNNSGTAELRKDSADTAPGTGTSNDGWKVITGGSAIQRLNYKLLEVSFSFTDHVAAYTQTGLTYSSMTATQFTPDTGQTNPTLDTVQLLIGNVDGITAYGGGALAERPQSLADLLSYTWSGSAWATANAWDTSTLSSSHYEVLYNGASPSYRSRVAEGVFESAITYTQFLTEICRGTASRVGVLSTGKSFMYPFGVTAAVVYDIPAGDIAALDWEQRDISTVVNRAIIKTGRSYIYAPRTFESQETVGYQYTTDYSADNYVAVRAMTLESRTTYGSKDLAATEFVVRPVASGGTEGYLGNSSSYASILAEYYLARFGKPLVYASFVIPYHRYSALKMFDIITFTSVDYPAFYGTDPNARDGAVDVSGAVSTVTSADFGYETVRAQTYRGLVEGISLVLAMEHAPAIQVTVLVLLNSPFDPT
jgi:hypothetical protein